MQAKHMRNKRSERKKSICNKLRLWLQHVINMFYSLFIYLLFIIYATAETP